MHLAAMQFNSSYEVIEADKAEGFMHTRGQEGGVIDFTSSYPVVGPNQRNYFSQIKTVRKISKQCFLKNSDKVILQSIKPYVNNLRIYTNLSIRTYLDENQMF